MSTSRICGAAVAVALVLSVGCGSKSKEGGALQAIQLISRAAQTTTSAKTARVSMDAHQGGSQIPADVWIDAQGRVRRMRLSLKLPSSPSSTTAAGTMTQTIEYYDFGVPVTATVPPVSEVTDTSDLIGSSPSP